MATASSSAAATVEQKPTFTIIFTIARMNPPTFGHIGLIEAMMQQSSQLPLEDLGHNKIFIFLSHTTEELTNPLDCNTKRDVLDKMLAELIPRYQGMAVTIFCIDDEDVGMRGKCNGISNWISKNFCRIYNSFTYSPIPRFELKLFLGSDRVIDGSYIFLTKPGGLDWMFGKDNASLERVPYGATRDAGPGIAGVSGTKMRKLALLEKPALLEESEFIKNSREAGLSLADAETLYRKVKENLNILIQQEVDDVINAKKGKTLDKLIKKLEKDLKLNREEIDMLLMLYFQGPIPVVADEIQSKRTKTQKTSGGKRRTSRRFKSKRFAYKKRTHRRRRVKSARY